MPPLASGTLPAADFREGRAGAPRQPFQPLPEKTETSPEPGAAWRTIERQRSMAKIGQLKKSLEAATPHLIVGSIRTLA
ncbi:MAG TPA: hypothetical protein VF194_19710, partial [Ferrovibrio sp.]|uniref:hypothetical protein n=1 Tax=Ferrovibrio sp. TaxID=1917215 RepID=UPI002ED4D66A